MNSKEEYILWKRSQGHLTGEGGGGQDKGVEQEEEAWNRRMKEVVPLRTTKGKASRRDEMKNIEIEDMEKE
jgi:hypothetical protein